MTDNILSQSEGSTTLPGQGGRMGGRMHGDKTSPDARSALSKTARATPERGGFRHGWRPVAIVLSCLIAAGVGFFGYQNQGIDHVTVTNAAATRVNEPNQVEAQAAARVADDEATKEAAERPTAELEEALKQERDKTEKLTRELAATRRVLETQATATAAAAAGAKTADNQQLAILRRALQEAEASTANYQELLVQERTRTRNLEQQLLAQQEPAPDLSSSDSGFSEMTPAPESGKPTADPLPSADNPVVVASANDKSVTVTAPPAAPEGVSEPKIIRLMARANQLLAMGDIAAARIVLDRAAELGNAQALFALAETYDPFSLSAWGTRGTQADATKAQELYAKALAAGIQKAKDRIDALRE